MSIFGNNITEKMSTLFRVDNCGFLLGNHIEHTPYVVPKEFCGLSKDYLTNYVVSEEGFDCEYDNKHYTRKIGVRLIINSINNKPCVWMRLNDRRRNINTINTNPWFQFGVVVSKIKCSDESC